MKNLKTLLSSKDMDWETPQDFYDKLNAEFQFTLDPCATKENAKCKKFYTIEDDGLKQDWRGHNVFCNPPYGSEIKRWVKRASEESKKPNTLIVMLIPARTDTLYFHEFIYKKPHVVIRFIKGRLKFGGKQKGSGSAPFPSMIVIFHENSFIDPDPLPEKNLKEF